MANISSYPYKKPKASDLILFSETYDINELNPVTGNPTKSASIGSIVTMVNAVNLGYTSLVQLLNQTGTNALVATEVYNNTGETFIWTSPFPGSGNFTLTSTGNTFTADKTVAFINGGSESSAFNNILSWSRISDNVIQMKTNGGTITNGSFEIKIYS